MRYFLIAGEASGDLHASRLMKALVDKDPAATFKFIGGDLMAAMAQSEPLQHYRKMNFMGVSAVVKNLNRIGRILSTAKTELLKFEPDLLILVDYAGFNLKMAKFAFENGFKTSYYITPKVWAWREKRIHKLKKYLDQLFVIFPFEQEYFKKQGMDVEYPGNPLVDIIGEFQERNQDQSGFIEEYDLQRKPVIALLAGSRPQEIEKCLPEMIEVAGHFPAYQFVVAGAPSVPADLYKKHLAETRIKLVDNRTYDLLSVSKAALVTSGTATLESALFDVPQVVVYKTGDLTYRIGKLFVTFTFFSLVNLLLGKELVKEFLQNDLAEKTKDELQQILNLESRKSEILKGYKEIRELLGGPGVSERAAEKMIELAED